MTLKIPQFDGPEDVAISYGQILESSAVIGGSSAITIAVGVVRTKALAMLLGPSGFGLFGIYASVIAVVEGLAGVGVSSSAVRQIAQSVGSGDDAQIARTAKVLLQVSLLLAFVGALLLALASRTVSRFTFGNSYYTGGIALLSLAVFCELMASGQRALIQGMRRVRDLAVSGVLTACLGLLVTLPIVFVLQDRGVVPSIVISGIVALLVTSHYRRKVRFDPPTMTREQQYYEASALLKLGFVFMTSYLATTGVAYLIRILVLRTIGYEATGLYQAAWTLGGMYVGFILQAMGTDFYPRLTAVAGDHELCNRLVNEQTEVGLLLAGPGILTTLALAPVVLFVFYSSKFAAAVGVLRWICLGTLLQVVTWPMSYILVAKGKQALFLASELAWAIASIGFAWLGIRWLGLNGVGMAFAGSYMVYGILLIFIVGRVSGFSWSKANRRLGVLYLCLIGLVAACFTLLPSKAAACVGGMVALLGLAYSIRELIKLVSSGLIPKRLRNLLSRINLIPPDIERAG